MGFYGDRILPRLINAACDSKDLRPLRQRACAGLSGDVVEIGFGSGLNVECYPAAVHRVTAVDPSGLGWKLASKRVAASSVPIVRSGLDGQSLPFGDGQAPCHQWHGHQPQLHRRQLRGLSDALLSTRTDMDPHRQVWTQQLKRG